MKKGNIFARCYVKMIIWGKRTIDDVKPQELRDEVVELLKAQGLGPDGKPLKEEPKEDTTPKEDTKPVDSENPKEETDKGDK
ncbi:CD1375 family protein [Finegoldia magna]|uniref:CD1375 family protein n=1 Tax=Finegoldia magna TaxID=1260 RepID=UPI000763D249|nr:CD1375 family protein [Finegoldia magna]KXA11135.1 hypothetical protein HMPREF3217_00103 [Finegoldia magna]